MLTHWSYVFLALTHRFFIYSELHASRKPVSERANWIKFILIKVELYVISKRITNMLHCVVHLLKIILRQTVNCATLSLKTKGYLFDLFDNFGVTDGTVSCRCGNLRCHKWRQCCQIGDRFCCFFQWCITLLRCGICPNNNCKQNNVFLFIFCLFLFLFIRFVLNCQFQTTEKWLGNRYNINGLFCLKN